MPLTIINLLYHRTKLNRDLFVWRELNQLKLVTFNNATRNLFSKGVDKSLISAMDALEKSYVSFVHVKKCSYHIYFEILIEIVLLQLKELYFIIVKHETEEVLEMYKYKFSYNKDAKENG